MRYFLISIVLCVSFQLQAQRKSRVRLKSMTAETPLAYQHWPMFFLENFDSLNLKKWDRSTAIPADDFPCGRPDGDPYFFMRPENVFVKDGFCHILSTKKSDTSVDTLCQPRMYCSGEIKSTTYQKSETDPFLNYNFPTDTYIEARIKVASNYRCHLGSFFWLWGIVGQELDILETSGVAENAFSLTLHEPELDKHPTRRIYLKDSEGERINMNEHFLNVGCMYSDSIIRLYVNGQEVYNRKPLSPLKPFILRLGNGYVSMARPKGNPLPPDECFPAEFLVDYVRAFQHPSRKSIAWLSANNKITNSEATLKVTYLPDAIYEWSAPNFDVRKETWDAWNFVKIKPTKPLQRGRKYPVSLKITFPDGHIESLEESVELEDDVRKAN